MTNRTLLKAAALLSLLLTAHTAFCLPKDQAEEAVAKEFSLCAGYHATRMMLMENAGQADEAIRDIGPTLKEFVRLAEQTRPRDDVGRWMMEGVRENAELIKAKGKEGLGFVMLRYSAPCKAALADPDARAKYWLAKE